MVSGAQHGLASVVLSMFSPGDVIAADALTYPGFKALAQTCHIELVPVQVTPKARIWQRWHNYAAGGKSAATSPCRHCIIRSAG